MTEDRSRRDFLIAGTAAAASIVLSRRTASAAVSFEEGAQSYSFRNFSFEDSITRLKEVGLSNMEFCSVHFPPSVSDPGFAQVKATIEKAGISVLCFGVEGFSADANANRAKFEFAKALGIGILTADPTPDSFDNLEALVEEFGVAIAIHNHGPRARYDKVTDTLNAVKDRHPLIGACVDTGHVIRSGEKPHEVIRALGSRVLSLHLKDWVHQGKEQIIGNGDLDVAEVVKALKDGAFKGPVMMEYEENPDNPVADMREGLGIWRAATKKA